MERIQHDLVQGTEEWLQFRMEHDGASEAAAVLGESTLTMRNELLSAFLVRQEGRYEPGHPSLFAR